MNILCPPEILDEPENSYDAPWVLSLLDKHGNFYDSTSSIRFVQSVSVRLMKSMARFKKSIPTMWWQYRGWVLAGLTMVTLIAIGVWQPWRVAKLVDETPSPVELKQSATPDPRNTYPTPYLNVRADVKYVGDKACAGCHVAHDQNYHQHPMSRSYSAVAESTAIERFDAAAFNPFDSGGYRYRVEKRGQTVSHVETVVDKSGQKRAETTAEIHHAVGSGRNGRAYLTDRDGYLFASPLTWFPQAGRWDLSPGYQKQNLHFGRPITTDCLFCHANSADPVRNTTNQYRQVQMHTAAIGCERCHGPGELHVASQLSGGVHGVLDTTIVNPSKLTHALREDICHQCHLQGQQRVLRRGRESFDFRPGLPLEEFMIEFVSATKQQGTKFVGSVEQMESSICYQKGPAEKKMGCISCHDPHSVPTPNNKVSFYRGQCVACHQDKGCSVPLASRLDALKQDNCVGCHMPPTGSNVNHTAITDHRILRRPERNTTVETIPTATNLVPIATSKVDHLELERDLGIALMRQADRLATADAKPLAERACKLLEAAVARDPNDLPAGESLGNAYWFLGRLEVAATAYDRVLAIMPDRETTLNLSASLYLRLNRPVLARSFAERSIRVNPQRWEYHLNLAMACGQSNDWKTAISACEAVVRLNPTELKARQTIVMGYARLGDKSGAQRAFDELLSLNPPQPDQLKKWFAQVVK